MVPFDDQSAEVGAADVLAMRKQAGFTLYIILGLLLALSLAVIALKAQNYRLELSEAKFDRFAGEVETKGLAAAKEAKRIDDENAKRKEKSDAERKRLIIANNGLADRLRDNAARSSLPEASGTSGIPETACFNRADLDAAIRKFTTGIAGIVTQGDGAVADLDNAKRWAER